MLNCFYCEQNGIARDGGDIALCHRCARKKCHRCGEASAGKTLCTNCEYGDEMAQDRGRAKEPWLFAEDNRFGRRFREELLWEAERMEMAGIRMFSRGRILALNAFYGLHGESEEKIVPSEKKKAA